ncbi:MAG: putative transposase [Methylophilaceae bacterium]|jgi:putative transposase
MEKQSKEIGTSDYFGFYEPRGNCYDNALMESFWGSPKNELIHQTQYKTIEEARDAIEEYMEVFYNRIRIHKKLDNISPAEALRNFKLM